MRERFEIAVLGAGFAGTLMALILKQFGREVVLLERGSHPRFSLGESSTPLANLALEEIARDYDLPWLADFAEYGRWKKTYPDLVCGLKRGFTFLKHEPDTHFVPDPDHGNELLVTASPADEVADTHWLRSDFDHFLVTKAVEAGVPYLDRAELTIEHAKPWRLKGSREGEAIELRVPFVIDATGPTFALMSAQGADLSPHGMRTSSWSIFSHFRDVKRWEEVVRELGGRTDEHPYPCDDAALHHVMDDGWIWVLRFDNGVTSAGVLIDGHHRRVEESMPPEEEWWAIVRRYPGIACQFEQATPIREFVRTGLLQRRAPTIAGTDWALLASSAYSLDALYSTGNAHALHSIQKLARILERHWGGELPEALAGYDAMLKREIAYLDLLVDGAYRAFPHFDKLQSFTMYYFAAAVTAEERRRQGKAQETDEFLSSHIPELRAAIERAYYAVGDRTIDAATFQRQVAADIAPWNTVGLCDPKKRNMYPY
jgi:FADH2 O2-dependent halogenase